MNFKLSNGQLIFYVHYKQSTLVEIVGYTHREYISIECLYAHPSHQSNWRTLSAEIFFGHNKRILITTSCKQSKLTPLLQIKLLAIDLVFL